MLRFPALKPCYCSTISNGQDMILEWSTIVYQKLHYMEKYPLAIAREDLRKKRYKGCLKKPASACYVTIYAGQTWQQTVVASATRSSKRSTSLKKTEETQKKTRESTGKLEPPLSLHRTQLSPVNTAHVLPFLHKTCLP